MPPKKNNMSAAATEELITQRSGDERTSHPARVYAYKEFLNCQPLNIKGTEWAVGLPTGLKRWNLCFTSVATLLNAKMIPDETDKVERYVGGFPNNIQGSVMASKPKIFQEAIEFTRSLMDQKVCAYATRKADNKKRMDNNLRENHAQQPPYKRQNVARAYIAGPSEKKEYAGTLPMCNKWHYHSECPRLKNENYRNQTGKGEARERLYALGGGEADQNPNNIADDIEA
nr:hypothetical protein [Tanacetum cinerariifolium]